ncbi:MAG: glycosyltransferase family 2 protein [Elusimicrobia bacterium]|nr:glycosyltransferase family 2 protein [Elusimicrobiota bacterium]
MIPCLNEAGNAALYEETLFKPLGKAGFESEVIFSDGGSTDGTIAILSALCGRRPEARLLGAAAPSAFAESLARALPVCRGGYVVFLEADLSFAPEDISKLLAAAKAGDYDCVCGSPFLGGFEGLGLLRRSLTYSANLLLRLRFGGEATSYTQIFKLFKASALRTLDFESRGFTLDAELLAKCLARGLKVAEIPVVMKARTRDSSKLNAAAEILGCLRLVVKGVR